MVRKSCYSANIEILPQELLELIKKIERVGRDELASTHMDSLKLTDTNYIMYSNDTYNAIGKLYS